MNLVVTGTSTGIGRALTGRLLAGGHQVWGLARSDQSGFAAQHPGAFRASRCDVSDWSQVARVVTEITAAWPQVDGLVTCAGVHGEVGPALAADPAQWSATVRANLDGTFFTLRALAPLLARAPRRTKVVCFSGGGATQARANFSAYGVAKTAIVRLVETVAAEESARSMDINAVAPGAMTTRLTEDIIARGPAVVGAAEYQAALAQNKSDGSALTKALDLVEWLLSPASDGISGRLLSASWDDWKSLAADRAALAGSELYTLRRITPGNRGAK